MCAQSPHLFDPVATPAGLEAVPLPFHLDVGAVTVDRVRRAQVVHRHEEVQVRLRLSDQVRSPRGTGEAPSEVTSGQVRPPIGTLRLHLSDQVGSPAGTEEAPSRNVS